MREGIHPDYQAAKVTCACGNVIETRSTRGDFHIEICASCHPFFTGKQKIMDTAGRIERFKTRYAAPAAQAKADAKPAAKAEKAAPEPKKTEPKENRAAKRAKANAGKPKPKSEAKPEAAPAVAAPEGAAGGETPTA
jgi:large subunit ribosomal protein L31